MLKNLIVTVGAAITVLSSAITGYRVHRWVLRHAPGLARLVPRDGGVLLGLMLGFVTVALWLMRPG
jgi:hypothetical protein